MELKLTPEQAKIVAAKKARHENKLKVDPEWFFIAEFGSFYGWEGVKTILNNEVDIDTANMLLLGARKVRAQHIIEDAVASQVAFSSAQSRTPKKTFSTGIKEFQKEARI